MTKHCPNCDHAFDSSERVAFVKDMGTDYRKCPVCNERYYVVVPEKKRLAWKALSAVGLLPTLLIVLLIATLLTGIFGSDVRGYIWALIGVGIVALTGHRAAARFFQWNFANIQDNPHTWD